MTLKDLLFIFLYTHNQKKQWLIFWKQAILLTTYGCMLTLKKIYLVDIVHCIVLSTIFLYVLDKSTWSTALHFCLKQSYLCFLSNVAVTALNLFCLFYFSSAEAWETISSTHKRWLTKLTGIQTSLKFQSLHKCEHFFLHSG